MTPAASVPEAAREVLPLAGIRDAPTRLEGLGTGAVRVSRSGEALLLTFEEDRP